MNIRTDDMIALLIIVWAVFVLLVWGNVPKAVSAEVNSFEVYDGDTLTHADVTAFPNIHYHGSVRIRGIDTPEIRTKSDCEKALGYKAKDALAALLKGKVVETSNEANGKYAGRVLADVTADGIDVGDYMIKNGYARKYDGGKRNHDWCK